MGDALGVSRFGWEKEMPLLEAGDRTSSSEEVAQNEMFARSFRYYLLSFKTGGNMRKVNVKRGTMIHGL